MKWTRNDMPSLDGRVWVVTGANSGLGLESAKALAAKGATVVMACRSPERAEAAALEVKRESADAKVELRQLDVSSLESIEAFASEVMAAHPVIDGLMNNAGIMMVPRALTVDGFESQLGTNHLGHFALSLRLLPALEKAESPRIVVIASQAHRQGRMNFDDLTAEKSYSASGAYGQSKLANLLFTYEAARRFKAAGKKTIVVAAHPGFSTTNLFSFSSRGGSRLMEWFVGLGSFLSQPAAAGALPQLYAASAPDVESGAYYGPDGWFELKGAPIRRDSNSHSKDLTSAKRLWELSEQLTGVRFSEAT
ncbi:MAG: oxidoreductase [Archangium sp.]